MRWKMVPAVADTRRAQPPHDQRPSASRHPVVAPDSGQRTAETVRSAEPVQVVTACLVIGKPCEHASVGPWIVDPSLRESTRHARGLLHSDGKAFSQNTMLVERMSTMGATKRKFTLEFRIEAAPALSSCCLLKLRYLVIPHC